MSNLEATFQSLPAFRLAGLRRWHALADAPKTIPDQWHDLHASNLPGLAEARVTYGATAQMDMPNQRFEYFAGYEVVDFNDIPAEQSMTVPASQYAIFPLNTVSEIRPFWQQFFAQWLPSSGYKLAGTPDFERYDERFDAVRRGPFDIWVPVHS